MNLTKCLLKYMNNFSCIINEISAMKGKLYHGLSLNFLALGSSVSRTEIHFIIEVIIFEITPLHISYSY